MACIISEGSPVEFEIFVFKYTILHLPTLNLICHFSAHSHTPLWDSVVYPYWLDISFPPKNLVPFADFQLSLCTPFPDDLLKFQMRQPPPNHRALLLAVLHPEGAQHKSSDLLPTSNPGTVPLRYPPTIPEALCKPE